MKPITHEEIQESVDLVHNMSESETRKFMKRMSKEQPYIQIYVAAICERGEFDDDNDADAFANLASIIWHAMCKAVGGGLAKVKSQEIDKSEAKMMKLYEYAEGKAESEWPDMVSAWMEGFNQRPLLEFLLQSLMSPENPYQVTPDGSGLIFTYLKVIIDCLDNAAIHRSL